MKRLSKLSLLPMAVLAAGLIAGAAGGPANAGTFEWTDAKGDATQFYQPATEGKLPNEPALDITKVTMASDGKALVLTTHVAKASPNASLGSGVFFRYAWSVNEATWNLRVGESHGQKLLQLRYTGDLVGFDLPCKDCSFKLDEKASTIAVTLPIASLTDGMAAADSPTACPGCRAGEDPLPKLARGAEFSALAVTAQRNYVRFFPQADAAPAPEGSLFVL